MFYCPGTPAYQFFRTGVEGFRYLAFGYGWLLTNQQILTPRNHNPQTPGTGNNKNKNQNLLRTPLHPIVYEALTYGEFIFLLHYVEPDLVKLSVVNSHYCRYPAFQIY